MPTDIDLSFGALVLLTIAIVGVVNGLNLLAAPWAPVLALLVAIGLSFLAAAALGQPILAAYLVVRGLIIGLTAAGTYSGGKHVFDTAISTNSSASPASPGA